MRQTALASISSVDYESFLGQALENTDIREYCDEIDRSSPKKISDKYGIPTRDASQLKDVVREYLDFSSDQLADFARNQKKLDDKLFKFLKDITL